MLSEAVSKEVQIPGDPPKSELKSRAVLFCSKQPGV
jgi:hypothetical protein